VLLLLNEGVHPKTNETIIPHSAFKEATTAHAIVFGRPDQPHLSIHGYGMGWGLQSYQGHEVRFFGI
jgi:hypothetical protein